jgi:hypothetical protein
MAPTFDKVNSYEPPIRPKVRLNTTTANFKHPTKKHQHQLNLRRGK